MVTNAAKGEPKLLRASSMYEFEFPSSEMVQRANTRREKKAKTENPSNTTMATTTPSSPKRYGVVSDETPTMASRKDRMNFLRVKSRTEQVNSDQWDPDTVAGCACVCVGWLGLFGCSDALRTKGSDERVPCVIVDTVLSDRRARVSR